MRRLDWILCIAILGLAAQAFMEMYVFKEVVADMHTQATSIQAFEDDTKHRLDLFAERLDIWIDRQENTEALIFGTVK